MDASQQRAPAGQQTFAIGLGDCRVETAGPPIAAADRTAGQPDPSDHRPRGNVERYPNLDILRLLLAIEVVYIHASLRADGRAIAPFVPAVPAFVLLSGFLIPASFASSRTVWHFAWKRALRILPCLLASFALVWVLFGSRETWGCIVYYLAAGLAGTAVNGPLWSLMVEEVLYAGHAITQVVRLWRPWTSVVCFLLAMIASIVWQRATIHGTQALRYLIPMVTFFLGNLAYWSRHWLMGHRRPILAAALLVLGSLLAMRRHQILLQSVYTFPLICAACFALALLLPQLTFWRMPDLSYSMYILHALVLASVLQHLHGSKWFVLGVTLPTMLPICLLSWYLVEANALRLKNWRPSFTRHRLGNGLPPRDRL